MVTDLLAHRGAWPHLEDVERRTRSRCAREVPLGLEYKEARYCHIEPAETWSKLVCGRGYLS